VNHYRRLYWLQAAVASLLVLALSGCLRSASSALTPLPSVPPATATMALAALTPATATRTARPSPTVTENTAPAEGTLPTESPQPQLVTATQTSTAVVCEGAPPARLRVGSFAYVNPDPPLPNNLRSEPGQDNTLIGEIQTGQAMSILEGPTCADGWLWWKVRTLETDLEGWTAEGDGQGYWLVPCSSEAECTEG
jgi:hypothetical protein